MDGTNAKVQFMYTLNQITFTSLLGSPIVGVYMMYRNLVAFNTMNLALKTLFIGLLVSVIALVGTIYLPEKSPGLGYAAVLVGILRLVASKTQGSLIEKSLSNGVGSASNWRCFGLGLIFLVITLSGLFAIALVLGVLGLLPATMYET